MAEIEVFRITPEKGKCYEHIEATRSEYLGGGNHKYFSTNVPKYVGRYLYQERDGYGDGGKVTAVFKDGPTEKRVEYSYEGNTCFIEVDCRNNANGGKRNTRKHKKRSKKSRHNRK